MGKKTATYKRKDIKQDELYTDINLLLWAGLSSFLDKIYHVWGKTIDDLAQQTYIKRR
jgi:hypothetical protein